MERTPLFKFLLIANALGAAYGFIFYYGGQLLSTNPLLWAFVPDCPLYAFLFAFVLVMLSEKIRADWFYFVVFVGAVKYGFWTMYVLWKYWGSYSPEGISFMYLVLFISHIVLFLEPVALLGKIRVNAEWPGLALFWFLLNDFIDYAFGTHPPIPPAHLNDIFVATVLMTFVFSLGSFWLVKRFETKEKKLGGRSSAAL